MKFKYTGDKESLSMYDITFPKGEEVEVDEKQVAYVAKTANPKLPNKTAMVVDKLSTHPEFERVKGKPGRKPRGETDGDSSGD